MIAAHIELLTKPGDYIVQIKYPGYRTDTFKLSIQRLSLESLCLSALQWFLTKFIRAISLLSEVSFFDFDSQSLNEQGKIDLEKLKPILKDHPELKIEITGHTDIIGSKDYNLVLADGRAQAVINYLTASGITGTRFIRRRLEPRISLRINTNPDGSDNPEGRRYNRRVTIGIINPADRHHFIAGILLLQKDSGSLIR